MEGKSITVVDWLLISVTLLGPVIAVQVQKAIERFSEKNERRNTIFRILMATRAVRAGSNEHVQALNLIELFFNGKGQKDRDVRDAWRLYFDELSRKGPLPQSDAELNARAERGSDLLVDLIYAMSKTLGYDFDKVQIKRGAYYPQGHQDDAYQRQIIREALVKIVQGEAAIPVVVQSPTEEARAASAAMIGSLTEVLSGKAALNVSVTDRCRAE